jgi:hypothetical protein
LFFLCFHFCGTSNRMLVLVLVLDISSSF